jgi:two-component system, LytTR family, sensor kinase
MNTRQFILAIASFCACFIGHAQTSGSQITFRWNGYSGSYIITKDSSPFIVAHIPYNEKYKAPDDPKPAIPEYTALADQYRTMLGKRYLNIITSDSSSVELLAPLLTRTNASRYEFRVIHHAGENAPWKEIVSFTKDEQGFDLLKKGIGELGSYSTGWDNYLIAELRKKGSDTLLSVVSIYWKQVHPSILNIYTTDEMNEFLVKFKQFGNVVLTTEDREKWKTNYPEKDLDSSSGLPKRLLLHAPINGIIFYLNGAVYKKEGIEYQLIHDGKIVRDWKPNDFDNNLIWLNNLSPGNYTLRFRYSGQRQNVSEYPFQVKPAWHQTAFFKIIFGGLIAAFFCFIAVVLQLRKQRQKFAKEELEKERLGYELKAIYAQLNPHFVFNALSSIQGLIGKKNFLEANIYLSKFSDLMRATLTGSEKEFITIDKEIEILKTYLSLEQLRFGFQYEVGLSNNIHPTETEIPFLLFQPLVENAVKHGVSSKGEQGRVQVNFERQGSQMRVSVSDNGSGFRENEPTSGFGIRLTRNRIEILNKLPGGRTITLSVLSESGKGTSVNLLFNNWFL